MSHFGPHSIFGRGMSSNSAAGGTAAGDQNAAARQSTSLHQNFAGGGKAPNMYVLYICLR
jgi:hypothetical protein